MTLVVQKPSGAKLLMRQTWAPADTDAAAYIAAVEAADGQALEEKTRKAIDDFVLGCKQDGVWSAIKASCILAGARTLTGALVPLAGAAPTNVGPFVSGDYSRKTGLLGDGSTKYLNSNRDGNTDPQNSCHVAVYKNDTATMTEGKALIGGRDTVGVRNSQIYYSASAWRLSVRTGFGGSVASTVSASTSGFIGCSRSTSTTLDFRLAQVSSNSNATSVAPVTGSHFVYANRAGASAEGQMATRLAFYSIGESLNLTLLDARVTQLITTFAAVIP